MRIVVSLFYPLNFPRACVGAVFRLGPHQKALSHNHNGQLKEKITVDFTATVYRHSERAVKGRFGAVEVCLQHGDMPGTQTEAFEAR